MVAPTVRKTFDLRMSIALPNPCATHKSAGSPPASSKATRIAAAPLRSASCGTYRGIRVGDPSCRSGGVAGDEHRRHNRKHLSIAADRNELQPPMALWQGLDLLKPLQLAPQHVTVAFGSHQFRESWPHASVRVQPKMVSACGFQDKMRPCKSISTSASRAASDRRRSRASRMASPSATWSSRSANRRASSALRTSCPRRKRCATSSSWARSMDSGCSFMLSIPVTLRRAPGRSGSLEEGANPLPVPEAGRMPAGRLAPRTFERPLHHPT